MKMITSIGLKFKKFDLQIHTPASDDYKDKKATPENIVNTAVSKGLEGIAITDHQTGSWIDSIKKAAKGKNLTVFPGVELKVHGGKDGIHIIVLLDIDKNSPHIAAFLNTLKVYDHNGKPDVIANKTVVDVARELQEFDPSAIMILAHCLSAKGVISDMRGEQRSEIFKPEWKCLLGAEARESDFIDEQKIKDNDRVVDLFDGGFKTFHFKQMGVYQVSDAHSVAEIGNECSYFKVDESVNIEDIRQCLIDRDTRIRQSFEYIETVYSHINKLKITSGFLADQELELHEGLNSLLGAKGAGKSLVIEFARFALNQPPQNEEILKDHESKIEKCLKLYGQVEVTFTDESGKKYLVRRTYNPVEGNPTEVIDISDNTKKDFEVQQIFPVLFLSQNEIIKIAEDKSGKTQRQFIDRFFDFYKYQQQITNLNDALKDADSQFADSLRAHLSVISLKKRIETYKEEIEKMGRQLKNQVFEKYSKQEKIGRAIKSQIDFLEELKESLETTEQEYQNLLPPSLEDKEISADPAIKRSSELAKNVIDQISKNIKDAANVLEQKKLEINQEYKNWETGFQIVKGEYDNLVKKTGGTQVILDQKRKQLILDLSKIERELTRHQGKAQQLKFRTSKRDEVIDKLDKAYKAYFDERKNRCSYFTKHSAGSLEVTIKEREDKTAFRTNLLTIKRGSWLKDDEIEIISDKVPPREFIDSILNYECSARADKKSIEALSKKTGIKLENIEKLIQHLLDEYPYEDILALLYNSVPEDVPLISYKVGTIFKQLDELSVGQKAVALLIIALSDGSFPIIIDQPEDSLDLRTIWDDVCVKLRGSKDKRQFIFTTHNSSVAVASDTDKFVILQADALRGRILFSGSMNRPDIKKEVITYLEGGKSTYDKKRQKYGL